MGAKVTIWAWKNAHRIDQKKPIVLLTLLTLADIANDRTGKLWAGQAYIAEKGHLSPRSVRSSLPILEDLGLIRREAKFGAVDAIWMLVTATTIYEHGPEPDEEITAQNSKKVRKARHGVPTQFGTDSDETAARSAAGVADKPKQPENRTIEATASVAGQADDVRQAFNAYNAMVVAMGGSPAKTLNDDRRRRLKARLKDCGDLEGWCEQMRRVPESPFLSGQTHHHFSITLDFLLQPSSFTKLVEGQYHDPNRSQTDGRETRSGPTDRAFERHQARTAPVLAGAMEALNRRRKWGLGD